MDLEGKRIVIVDEEFISRPLKDFFTLEGAQVIEFSPMDEIEQKIQKEQYHTLITDPFFWYGKNGHSYDAKLEAIIAHTRTQKAKILFLSTQEEDESKKRGLSFPKHYDAYLVKPESSREILRTLTTLLT